MTTTKHSTTTNTKPRSGDGDSGVNPPDSVDVPEDGRVVLLDAKGRPLVRRIGFRT